MKGKSNGRTNCGTAERTQAEVAAMFGVRLQSVQYVEYMALKKIRRAIEEKAAAAGVTPLDWLRGEHD